jgi:hypothetical protein
MDSKELLQKREEDAWLSAKTVSLSSLKKIVVGSVGAS